MWQRRGHGCKRTKPEARACKLCYNEFVSQHRILEEERSHTSALLFLRRLSMKTIALIAHDGKKADMVAFATFNRERLRTYHLVATASTGRLLNEKVGLDVERVASGPYGGDAQIGARVVAGEIGAVIFLVD